MVSLFLSLMVGMAVAATANSGKARKIVQKYEVGQAYAVLVGFIHWFPSMNAAREVQPHLKAGNKSKETGVKGGVFESLVDKGWASELPAQAVALPYTLLKGIDVETAIKQRQAFVAELEKADNMALAAICRDIWCVNGKWVAPLFAGNSGFTRGLSLPDVLLAKARQAIENNEAFDAKSFTVQVVVKEFTSEVERLTEQAFENESRKMAGVSDMNWPDRLKSGKALLKAAGKAANERTLRRAFGDGNGMKTYAILTADARFPSLNLVERIKMVRPDGWDKSPESYVKGGYIPAASIPQNAKALREASDVETAEKWLVETIYKGGNAPKVMGKDQWEASTVTLSVQDGSPLAAIIHAHLHNEGLTTIAETYPELCRADYVGSAGKGKVAETKAKVKAKA